MLSSPDMQVFKGVVYEMSLLMENSLGGHDWRRGKPQPVDEIYW